MNEGTALSVGDRVVMMVVAVDSLAHAVTKVAIKQVKASFFRQFLPSLSPEDEYLLETG